MVSSTDPPPAGRPSFASLSGFTSSTSFRCPAGITALAILAVAGPAIPAGAAAPLDDFARHDLLSLSPSASSGSIGGFVNPAAWATSASSDFSFWWNDRSIREDALDSWGVSQGGLLGTAWERRAFVGSDGPMRVYDGRVGLATGDRRHHRGVAWTWSTGDKEAARRENGVLLGVIERPNRFLSWGSSLFLSTESDRRAAVGDLAIRPLGDPRLTLFGDYALRDDQRAQDGRWSVGAQVRPVPGIHLGGRIRETPDGEDLETVFHVGLTIGGAGFSVLPAYDAGGDRGATTYVVRSNPPYRGLPLDSWIASTIGPRRWEPLNLEKKRIRHQRDKWFDDDRVAWIDLARRIEAIRRDPLAAGIALNLSGTSIRPSVLWELRTELARCRAAGKQVAVHFDRAGMATYYLASVADHITMDPQGDLLLPGFALRRTYLKGALEKMGVGFEEYRFFEYKSANETFARSDMSAADREQMERIVDVLYEEMRDGVVDGRGITAEDFDAIVDGEVIIPPDRAVELGLVDAVGRWSDLAKWIREDRGGIVGVRARPADGRYPDERWGRPPAVAVVYARGVCAMDTGIRGRATSKAMRGFSERADIAAVVLRADSPGGDPLPSELVADATRSLREKGKPVVVSQGDVAASGGYWISMDGDRVLTTPLTVTGSIGVISGWFWDDGLADKVGLTTDGVQRGSHADLFSGVRFPLVGLRLPERNLDDAEREHWRDRILEAYDGFVEKVAQGRGLDEDTVREIAQGRVWMGEDAVARGLCDATGTLLDAIAEARDLAGIPLDEEIRLVEFPPRRLFRLPDLLPSIPGIGILRRGLFGGRESAAVGADSPSDDYPTVYLKTMATQPGKPMVLISPDVLPAEWGEQ